MVTRRFSGLDGASVLLLGLTCLSRLFDLPPPLVDGLSLPLVGVEAFFDKDLVVLFELFGSDKEDELEGDETGTLKRFLLDRRDMMILKLSRKQNITMMATIQKLPSFGTHLFVVTYLE